MNDREKYEVVFLEMFCFFTDASYEKDSADEACRVGGVIYLPNGDKRFCSVMLDARERAALGELQQKTSNL